MSDATREALDALLAFRHGNTTHLTPEHARVLYAALQQPETGEPVAYRWRTRRHDNSNAWQFTDKFSPALMESCIEFEPLYTAPPASADLREALEKKLRELDATWQVHGGPFDGEWVETVLESLANARGTESEGRSCGSLPSGESDHPVTNGCRPSDPTREAVARIITACVGSKADPNFVERRWLTGVDEAVDRILALTSGGR
jgi:hypothetical protein